jgi:prefoldin subunit 5
MDSKVNNGPPMSPDRWVDNYIDPAIEKHQLNQSQSLDGYLKLLADGDGLGDLAFVILAMQIRKHDKAINDKIKNIQHLSNMKEAMGKKLDKLRQLKQLMESNTGLNHDGDGEVSLAELSASAGIGSGHPSADELKQICDRYGLLDSEFDVDPVTGTVTETGTKLFGSNVDVGKEGDGFRLKTKQIDEAISRLTDKMQRLTSDTEIETIKLNDLISKKGQAVQLLSNIQKKENDTQQGIIANFK